MNLEPIAQAPGLVYVGETGRGIRRRRRGKGFCYLDADGTPLRDPRRLARIRSLGIPPGYEQVWICPTDNGHLRATGRDARGRKQYLYHPQWRSVRNAAKFERMLEFGQVLGRLRARVDHDLAARDLGKRSVTAAIVRLLDTTCMRVGNHDMRAPTAPMASPPCAIRMPGSRSSASG